MTSTLTGQTLSGSEDDVDGRLATKAVSGTRLPNDEKENIPILGATGRSLLTQHGEEEDFIMVNKE